MDSHNKYNQRKRQAAGVAGQVAAHAALAALGVRGLRDVHTGMAKIGGKYSHARKVEGDLRGILPGGRGVLAEVKHSVSATLSWSVTKPHQRMALFEHAHYGGLALLVWVNGDSVAVMEYMRLLDEGWRPRNHNRLVIRWDVAQRLSWTPEGDQWTPSQVLKGEPAYPSWLL